MYLIDQLLDSDSNQTSILHPLLVKNKPNYALIPDRKILAKYYASTIDSFPILSRIYLNDKVEPIYSDQREDNFEEEIQIEIAEEGPIIQKYFPNPVLDILNIETRSISSFEIVVLDDQNKIVLKDNFSGNRKSLSMNNLGTGTYFVQITSAKLNKSEVLKVIVR